VKQPVHRNSGFVTAAKPERLECRPQQSVTSRVGLLLLPEDIFLLDHLLSQ